MRRFNRYTRLLPLLTLLALTLAACDTTTPTASPTPTSTPSSYTDCGLPVLFPTPLPSKPFHLRLQNYTDISFDCVMIGGLARFGPLGSQEQTAHQTINHLTSCIRIDAYKRDKKYTSDGDCPADSSLSNGYYTFELKLAGNSDPSVSPKITYTVTKDPGPAASINQETAIQLALGRLSIAAGMPEGPATHNPRNPISNPQHPWKRRSAAWLRTGR